MKTARAGLGWIVAVVVMIAASAATAGAQESLARAKAFYAAAAYEDALAALSSVAPSAPSLVVTEAAAYKVFCLLALGRTDDARRAVEAVVRLDPRYRPSEAQASPRVVAFFDETRRSMLANVARQSYASAREAYKREDMRTAAREFRQAIAQIDVVTEGGDTSLEDMRALAIGFKELADEAVAKAEAEEAARLAADEAARLEAEEARRKAALPDPNRVYTDEEAGIVKPTPVSRTLPIWEPLSKADEGRAFTGVVEVVIGNDGRVESAVLRETVHPAYDGVLLRAAQRWRFTPATKDGVAVKYLYRLGIRIGG